MCYAYERIIEQKLVREKQEKLSPICKQVTERILATKGKPHICTIDLEKAFESVQRENIWRSL